MVTRLIVVLLTLVGPLPFRVCTCAATPTSSNDRHCPSTEPVKACGSCSHHHEPADADRDGVDDAVRAASHTHPPEHQPSCPIAQVRPAVDATASTGVHDTSVESACELVVSATDLLFSTRHAVGTHAQTPRAPARPLFITLLTLRN